MKTIADRLFMLSDKDYLDFESALIPTVEKTTVIGVRTPLLKRLAKEIAGSDIEKAFLDELPHAYFDENQLHALCISNQKEFDVCLEQIDRFLPYVDNWATCDLIIPKSFGKNRSLLEKPMAKWLESVHPFTVRFGIKMLMSHFLDQDFEPKYLDRVVAVQSQHYYVNMMSAWYFATALAKQYDMAVKVLENHQLSPWVHHKTIRKACESYRISSDQKAYLRTLIIAKADVGKETQ